MKKLLFFLLLVCGFKSQSQTIPNYVPTNNLLGYWPFDGNANDLSTGAHHGTVNGPVLTTDRFNVANKAYSFNGANSNNITVPDHPSFSGFNDLSISVWVNFAQFSNIQNIIAKWYQTLNCGSNSDTYLTATVDSSLYWNTNNYNVALQSNPPTFGLSKLNQWQHLVFTSSSTSGESIYVNGVLAATYNANIGAICASTNALVFGAGSNGTTSGLHRFFNGKLDDIGLWNRVLTNCEIQQLYTSSLASGNFTVSSTSNVLCAGMTATLTASGPGTYTWNNTPGGSSFTINPVMTTTYNVIGASTITGCPGAVAFVQQVKLCDGIENNGTLTEIQLYPNPVEDQLFLDLGDNMIKEYKVSLKDITGKTILSRSIMESRTIINTSAVAEGCYFVQICDEKNNQIKHAKLVITH